MFTLSAREPTVDVYRRLQNLRSTDVLFWRLKSVPALKGLITCIRYTASSASHPSILHLSQQPERTNTVTIETPLGPDIDENKVVYHFTLLIPPAILW